MSETSAEKSPVACSLSAATQRERGEAIRTGLLGKASGVRELDAGFEIRFERSDGLIGEVAAFIAFESGCCAFADFALEVPAGQGPISLRVTGPDGTKEVFRAAFE